MRKVWLVVVLLAAIAGITAGAEQLRSADTYQPLALYSEAMSIIHDKYVDALPWTKLVEDGTRGMIQALDPDSALLDPQQVRDLASPPQPVDGDVGLVLGRRDGGLAIIAARNGSPAGAAGLRSGDDVLEIRGVSTEGMLPIDAAGRLRGQPGTEVTLRVGRAGWTESKPFTLTLAKPPSGRVIDRPLGDRIIYIRIPVVRDATAQELGQLLDEPPAEGTSGIVLDLRDTPGGEMSAAAAVAGLFLDPRCVVTHVQSRVPGQSRELVTPPGISRHDQPMAVLVNHGTESAAEVLTGALQDWGRAAVVGSTTFGDASAQSLIPLPDGWSLSLTTARYLTPKGRAISRHGIVPDVASMMPPPATERAAAMSAKAGSPDPDVQLAFDLVKAARILEHEPTPAAGPAQAGDGVRWCGSPAA
jgi:carboxyl-terminal processing protease